MMNQERRILLGRVLGAFGVRGEIKLQSFTDPPMSLLKYQPWQMLHAGVECELSGATGRDTAKGVVARFPGIEDRDAAEALRGAEVWVPRSRLPAPKLGDYYWVDLEGMTVVNCEGVTLGVVSHLFDTAANDVMVVVGERERLLPFITGQCILDVDFAVRMISVDWDADF